MDCTRYSHDPAAAVASTLGLQRGMAAIGESCGIPFKMRCGLHAGVSQIRDGDYFGGTVNRAARIAGAAHGGQILVSQSVIDLGRGPIRAGHRFSASGACPPARPVESRRHLATRCPTNLQRTFPPLRSLDSTPNNLPQQLTSFIGRENEIAEMKALLGKTRLLTLTGSGGCGKTRLSLQVAADAARRVSRMACGWSNSRRLADPDLVPQALATVLGLKEERGVSLMETIIVHLKSRRLLLLLDNCRTPARRRARNWPTPCCASARKWCCWPAAAKALGIGGRTDLSRAVVVDARPAARRRRPTSLSQFESVRLFVERARAHHPQFAVTRQNAPALASICSRLDGIPLALELAAARVRALSVEEVNQRLDERFRLLTEDRAPPCRASRRCAR